MVEKHQRLTMFLKEEVIDLTIPLSHWGGFSVSLLSNKKSQLFLKFKRPPDELRKEDREKTLQFTKFPFFERIRIEEVMASQYV